MKEVNLDLLQEKCIKMHCPPHYFICNMLFLLVGKKMFRAATFIGSSSELDLGKLSSSGPYSFRTFFWSNLNLRS
jgi:hypothetical protein